MKYSKSQVEKALGEAQGLLNWTLNITVAAKVAGTFPENLQMRVTTTGTPVEQVERAEVKLYGHTIRQNGKTSKAGEITATFIEGTDQGVYDYFDPWINKSWSSNETDTTGTQALSADCKATITITMFGPEDKATMTYKLIGCLVSWVNAPDLGQDVGIWQPQIKIEFDDFKRGKGDKVQR